MKFYTLNENISNLRGRSLYNSVDDSLSAMELDAYVNRFYSDDSFLVISVGRGVNKREVEDIVFPYGYAYYDAGANDDRMMLTFQRVSTVGESMVLTEGKFVNNKKGYFEVATPGDDSAYDGEYPEIPGFDNKYARKDEITKIDYTYDDKLEKLRDELENLYFEVNGEYSIDVESEDSYINTVLYDTPMTKFDVASYKRICRELIKHFKNKLSYPLKEEFGVDFADTLAWVEKKRPDLSRGAQIKFARNIIAKRQREMLSAAPARPQAIPTPPSRRSEPVYQIWGDYDTAPKDTIRPVFCYAHGELESDMGFDVFSIDSSFDVNMIDDHIARKGAYKCIYKGKPCTLDIFTQRGMQFGLCYYDDDIEAKEYVEREKRNPRP